MRPIWKGQISFGLINIPIELYSADKSRSVQFKLLDNRNHAKIHYERINEETGEQVPWDEIVKAYEVPHKGYVILNDNDFKQAAIENTQAFEIEDFIDKKNLSCLFFEKPYYLVPAKRAQKGYVLLREVLKKTEKIAIGKVIIRSRQYLAALLPLGEVLVLNLLRFADEVKSTEDLNIPTGDIKGYKISEKEMEMAQQLVESMTVDWDPEKYHDDYRDSLMKWIEKKAKLGNIPFPAKPKEEERKSAEVVDFMSLLKKSIKKTEPKKQKKQSVSRSSRAQSATRKRAKKQ